MEIEVGEWVRTKKGQIDKVISLNRNDEILLCKTRKFWLENIINHSKNIIDLISVGDYVNGYKVVNVILDIAPTGKCVDIDCCKQSEECTFWEEDIKSIVTKEQFEKNSYKVEE